MLESNKIIHGLWIGTQLSYLELLTINSFVQHGHEFHLWLYNEIEQDLPAKVVIQDANEIISSDQVFQYKKATVSGIGKGSYAGFSDIFRYKLLYDKGGWWADMDVTCLKPFDIEANYFFPREVTMPLTGKLIKSPKGSELMQYCYLEALATIDESNTNWYKPIDILIGGVEKYGLTEFIVKDFVNWDSYVFVDVLRNYKCEMPQRISAFHWSNEQWRNRNFNKNNYRKNSAFGNLLNTYHVILSIGDLDESRNTFGKKTQLFLFKILYHNLYLLKTLKKIKNVFSGKHNFWI